MSKTSAGCCLFGICVLLWFAGAAEASDHVRVTLSNRTQYEIIQIDMELETRHEPRRDSARVYLNTGDSYSIGFAGAIKPLRISAEVVDALLVFDDLSDLEASQEIRLEITCGDDGPLLRQPESADGAAQAGGRLVKFVTDVNAAAAVDKDDIVAAATIPAVHATVAEHVETLQARFGEATSFEVDAGPILTNAQARERCPEVAREWSEKHGGDAEARWSGDWTTTVPGEMSVCNVRCGPPRLEEVLTQENESLHFPVVWNGNIGAGRATQLYQDSAEVGIVISLRMSDNVMREAKDDLFADGLRPWQFRLDKRTTGSADDVDIDFTERGVSAEEAWDIAIEEYLAARSAGSLREMDLILVGEAQFRAIQAGNQDIDYPAALLQCGRNSLQATFFPGNRP